MKFQRGVALSGLMFWGVILALLSLLAMKVAPSAIEYYKIKKDIKAVVEQAAPEATVVDLRRSFSKFAEVDQLDFSANQLDISKDRTGQIVIAFAYEKRIPLFANVSLVIDYKGSTAE